MIVKQTHALRLGIVVLAVVSLCITSLIVLGNHQVAHAATSITGLHVSGNQLLNGNNQPVRALGVDRSGTEFECASRGGNGGNPFDEAIRFHIRGRDGKLGYQCGARANQRRIPRQRMVYVTGQ